MVRGGTLADFSASLGRSYWRANICLASPILPLPWVPVEFYFSRTVLLDYGKMTTDFIPLQLESCIRVQGLIRTELRGQLASPVAIAIGYQELGTSLQTPVLADCQGESAGKH